MDNEAYVDWLTFMHLGKTGGMFAHSILSKFYEEYQSTYPGITTNSKSDQYKEIHAWTHHHQTVEGQKQR